MAKCHKNGPLGATECLCCCHFAFATLTALPPMSSHADGDAR